MPDAIVQLSPHFSVETLYDGKLTIYKVTRGDRDTVELWAREVVARTTDLQPDVMPLVLHDFSFPQLDFSPFMRRRAEEVANEIGTRPVKIAITFPNNTLLSSLIAQILQNFQRTILRAHPERTVRLFESREAALEWLKTFLE